jgi:peroxiredoxin
MKHGLFSICFAASIALSIASLHAAPISQSLPDIALVDSAGKKQTLSALKADAKVFVIGFYSKNCPFNIKRWDRIAALAKEYQGKGVAFVGVNPNPGESLADVIEAAGKHGISYPILRDEGKALVKALGAKATPHMYVFDEKSILRYAGALDDSADANEVKVQFAKDAIDAILAGKAVSNPEPKAFIGCSIKD